MEQRRIVLLSNPGSGNNRRHWARVEACLAQHPEVEHHVTPTPDAAAAVVAELATAPPGVVVINGGDGTIAAAIGMILERWPRGDWPLFMVLPGGTANMTAGDIGIATAQRRALRQFSRWLARGAPHEGEEQRARHIMRVTGAADGQPRHGMFLGTGAVMQATRYAHSDVHSKGLGGELSLGLILIRSLWGLIRQDPRFYQPTEVGLDLRLQDGAAARRDSAPMLILAASTLDRLFLGLRPFWAARAGGPIGLTTIRGGARHLGRTILPLLRGRPNRHATPENGYESFHAAQVTLDFEGEVNLDGELFAVASGDTALTVSAEGPIRFLCPK